MRAEARVTTFAAAPSALACPFWHPKKAFFFVPSSSALRIIPPCSHPKRVSFPPFHAAPGVLLQLLNHHLTGNSLHFIKSFLFLQGDKWRNRRKLLTPSFHSRVLDDFLEPLYREARFLADAKMAAHVGGAPFDIVPYAKLAALDVICGTIRRLCAGDTARYPHSPHTHPPRVPLLVAAWACGMPVPDWSRD